MNTLQQVDIIELVCSDLYAVYMRHDCHAIIRNNILCKQNDLWVERQTKYE